MINYRVAIMPNGQIFCVFALLLPVNRPTIAGWIVSSHFLLFTIMTGRNVAAADVPFDGFGRGALFTGLGTTGSETTS